MHQNRDIAVALSFCWLMIIVLATNWKVIGEALLFLWNTSFYIDFHVCSFFNKIIIKKIYFQSSILQLDDFLSGT